MASTSSDRTSPGPINRLAAFILRRLGWKLIHNPPPAPSSVIIAAPHTSVIDMIMTGLYLLAINERCYWPGPSLLFGVPFRRVVASHGELTMEIGEGRGHTNRLVNLLRSKERVNLLLVPEGTFFYVPRWHSGFYHITREANVPLVLAYTDYRKREIGMGEWFYPGADKKAVIARLRNFYADKTPLFPSRAGPIRF